MNDEPKPKSHWTKPGAYMRGEMPRETKREEILRKIDNATKFADVFKQEQEAYNSQLREVPFERISAAEFVEVKEAVLKRTLAMVKFALKHNDPAAVDKDLHLIGALFGKKSRVYIESQELIKGYRESNPKS